MAAGLYAAHHAWLVGWLTRRVRDTADAADLAQDTFVRVICRAASELHAVQEPRAYLTSIAKGLVVDHWRRRDIEQAWLDALALMPEPQAPSPEVRLIVLETLVRIDAMLDGLAPAMRSALLWARLDGATVPDIAQRLGVSVATAERYLARALRHCYDLVYGT
ncbi:sigma-70 family RNA polymerase sigma factor [Paraburkholderia metrosideri]|uniref:Sigma-70 family RNA polymerase sigma factor n=1 Tax=Paraburkholderia metrosideri TaxID=580937 RepID=A0ABW9DLS3_9BURK